MLYKTEVYLITEVNAVNTDMLNKNLQYVSLIYHSALVGIHPCEDEVIPIGSLKWKSSVATCDHKEEKKFLKLCELAISYLPLSFD